MATEEVKVVEQSPLEKKPEEAEGEVSVELPAPSGWKKKVLPKKGRTPGRDDVIFITPSGEEIKTKRQLNQYLKSNPGGPASSEFDWSTGETPRRSVRISEKAKSTESPEDEPPKKKRGRKSLSEKKKEEQEEKDTDVKDKNDAEPMDEKKEENEVKDAGAAKVGDAEMKDVEAVEVAADPATAEPENNPEGKVQENNEVKHVEPPSADAALVENNVGVEVGLHEGSDAKPAGSDAAPLENKEINGTKCDEPTGPDATSFQNNIGAEVGPQDGFNANGNNY